MPDYEPQAPGPAQPSGPETNLPPVMDEPKAATGWPYVLQTLAGFVAFWSLLLGIVALVIIASMLQQRPPYAGVWLTLSIFPIVLGVVLLGWRARRGRGLGLGVVIGAGTLGLLGLAVGLCFAALK